ncbi:bleomycin resistance protein [Aureibaculum algae]|uniref:Bleomycin resistance protein n=1 Tax=Aureibaculum algae TaxID=2584122 RepID=A0A5B7TRR4_9FLAO|nr:MULTISPECIES: VOC family protein [Aureibaculum]QCX39455.1 bleomycin resistance protein [Aureibaculum algae]
MNAPFHLSLPCLDIEATRNFYIDKLGADLGRVAQNWLDINLYGNQITFTKSGKFDFSFQNYSFEGKILPSFHFGIIVTHEVWEKLYKRITSQHIELFEEITFLKGKNGEHTSFFVKDPNDYMVEFKTFAVTKDVFKTN